MMAPRPLNIGIDNATVVLRGNEIIRHLRRRREEKRYDEKGIRKLGGRISMLHR